MKPWNIPVLLCMLALASCGGDSETNGQAGGSVPDGAWKTRQTFTNRYAPAGFAAVVGWAQIATLSPNQPLSEPASVDVDWWRLVEEDPVTGRVILYEEQYGTSNPQGLTAGQGGLYDRVPTWFDNNDHHVPISYSVIQNGVLSVNVAPTPVNIAHWWTGRRICKTTATYYVEMRVRISGRVGLQVGGDFWRDLTIGYGGTNINNREYFASDWYGDTGGAYIDIRAPRF